MDNEIIDEVLKTLEVDDIWFTQKTDPTYQEPPSYYELDEYGDLTEKSIKQITKEVQDNIGDGAVGIDDAIEMWVNDKLQEYKISYRDMLVTKFKDKPVVDQIDAYEVGKDKLEETSRRRIEEENNRSRKIITDMISSEDFDSNSKQGQIVLKTSDLFNALSDLGYDVQVSFDNGESQSVIIFGQQNAKAIITITNADKEIKAYISGNFELNEDNTNLISNLYNNINNL